MASSTAQRVAMVTMHASADRLVAVVRVKEGRPVNGG